MGDDKKDKKEKKKEKFSYDDETNNPFVGIIVSYRTYAVQVREVKKVINEFFIDLDEEDLETLASKCVRATHLAAAFDGDLESEGGNA